MIGVLSLKQENHTLVAWRLSPAPVCQTTRLKCLKITNKQE